MILKPKSTFYDLGNVVYRLKQIDNDGKFEYSNVVEVTAENVVTTYALNQNHPNPFNPSTRISYGLPEAGFVSLKVYNLLGMEVATLFDGVRQPGNYDATFNGNGLASGVYFYTLEAENFVETKKLLLLK